ncbi:hypothetical protein ASPACDRAFT_1854572 [Aspergillus aculeatus ATCC 16872]|uniref:gamma-glutamylcyclotransferase n=1 Tax=Aspergillus aculeatus (strain ATCC 16872 / CBS 172.66 / WB 5094) TaxID=690307 RepID=A0A1L9WYN8_ASPA1|nr:uncharacterized protein ASPACDRAFT_1854572 [Aspergillus aculeatus ATCC 16872]OJK01176.1 hypothetical protein ASPACDRAFT_1854572 [Aspergillus aculeatus ATCC 16872]
MVHRETSDMGDAPQQQQQQQQQQQPSSLTTTTMANPSLNRDTHLAEKLAALQAHGVSAQSLPTSDDSVLYLAYGSNLNSETFLGMRGIRPLSSTNVVVPSLWLTFDLPGIPYAEPCFAATRYRRGAAEGIEDEDRGYQDGEGIANVRSDTDNAPPKETDSSLPLLTNHNRNHNPTGGEPDYSPRMPLVGVVYEVTLSDYARIIATEGGGRGYIDTVIDCYAFPKTYNPHTDPHTHYCPLARRLLLLLLLLLLPQPQPQPQPPIPPKTPKSTRPNPFYAQPSARYLGLIRAGAAEHNLPRAYRSYLAGIRPYRITTRRQRVGQVAFLAAWGPLVMVLIGLGRALAGPDGRHPGWLVRAQDAVFGAMWRSYDSFFVRVFGDGERTVGSAVMEGEDGDGDGVVGVMDVPEGEGVC